MPDARRAPAKKPKSPSVRRRRGIVGFVLGAVVLVGLLFAFVYPTRTFLDQRNDTAGARATLNMLQTENAKLKATATRLQDPAEVERLARQYGMLRPNEKAFVIVPAPTTPPVTTRPDAGAAATPSP
ncbi:MAG: septum formation initiator family protein [Acidimicrobiia bacterium]